ncbi:MAG: hypothetical protein JWM78_290 [Verrucomicrobiaceae bacterium]|nr:hypothetical protein [Verrucomicrobiaceae bacterium]
MLRKVSLVFVSALLCANNVFANGALAIDGNQGNQYGFSYNQPSMGAAQQVALSQCGSGCSVVEVFSNGCAAYAADQSQGSTVYGWGTGLNGGQAQNAALQYCSGNGGSQCVVRVWGCNAQ